MGTLKRPVVDATPTGSKATLPAFEKRFGCIPNEPTDTSLAEEKARPLLESLHAWATDLQMYAAFGEARQCLAYLLKQRPKLIRYTEDGQVASIPTLPKT